MNLTAPASFTPTLDKHHNHGVMNRGKGVNKNSQSFRRLNFFDEQAKEREEIAAMLWLAFPADSERAVSILASPYVGKTDRMVRKYLRCEADAPSVVRRILKTIIATKKLARRIENAPLQNCMAVHETSGHSHP